MATMKVVIRISNIYIQIFWEVLSLGTEKSKTLNGFGFEMKYYMI